MIRVVTGSRLHFGLIAPALVEGESSTGKIFGGAGLMVEQPGMVLELAPAEVWKCQGPLAERAEVELQRLRTQFDWLFQGLPPHTVHIRSTSPEHVGLGTGTQLAYAITRLVAEAIPHHGLDLQRLTQRRTRSAIGCHGFQQGGFLIDGGWSTSLRRAARSRNRLSGVAPLVARHEFPTEWPIVLLIPRTLQGCHAEAERQSFAGMAPLARAFRDAQCTRLLLDILPALVERDLPTFGEALHHYNRAAGEPFRTIQGGPYSSPQVEELLTAIRELLIPGTGQSSWGPTVFAITQDQDQAEWLVSQLRGAGQLDERDIIITCARNQGAVVTRE